MPAASDAEIREILGFGRIAVVGCSSTPGTAAHEVPKYLQNQGYEIVPVNPTADQVLDERAYDSLSAVDREIDVVEVFRPSEELAGIVEEALEREDVRAIWTQLGISDPDAIERSEAAGIPVVEDRCMKVEHRRLVGE